MAELFTQVSFRSSAFNISEDKPTFINSNNFGDDVAARMMEVLASQGWHVGGDDATHPGQEDFGWYFGFGREKEDWSFVLSHIVEEPDLWFGWVERNASFLGSIFGGRNKGIQPEPANAIHQALLAMPEVHSIQWTDRSDDPVEPKNPRSTPVG